MPRDIPRAPRLRVPPALDLRPIVFDLPPPPPEPFPYFEKLIVTFLVILCLFWALAIGVEIGQQSQTDLQFRGNTVPRHPDAGAALRYPDAAAVHQRGTNDVVVPEEPDTVFICLSAGLKVKKLLCDSTGCFASTGVKGAEYYVKCM